MEKFTLPPIKATPPEVTKHVIVNKVLTMVFCIHDTLEEAQRILDNEFLEKENFRILTLKFSLISYQHVCLQGNPAVIVDGLELQVVNCFSFLHKLFIYEVTFISSSNRIVPEYLTKVLIFNCMYK